MLPSLLFSQTYFLEFEGSDEDLREVSKYNIEKSSTDSLQLLDHINQLKRTLQSEGFLSADLNPNWQSSHHLSVSIKLGNRFRWVKLDAGNVDPMLLQKAGYRERMYANKPFNHLEVQSLMNQLVKLSGNSGYPFASVKLDSVSVGKTEIAARLVYNSGPQITFDSVILTQPVRVKSRFIQAYLKVRTGEPFSEAVIEEIPERIKKLPYLRLIETPNLSFQNDQASTYLTLEEVNSNRIDGVIGFLPNGKGEGDLLLTGQFDLKLQNMFGNGRGLGFHWESFKPESQLLDINFYQPIVFGSPIDLIARFHLFKEDSSFVNRSFHLDLGYAYKRHFFGGYTHLKSARLPSSGLLDEVTNFPDLADFNLNQFGGIYRWDNLDDYLLPRSGFKAELRASSGIKRIKRNSAITDSLYQELDLESNQFFWELNLMGFVPLSKHWIITGQWRGGGVYNQRLFFNDLFRIGGLKSLRGFSENVFFADNFGYSNIEPRFFFEPGSYLFIFYDQAWWLKYSLENNHFKDRPWGLGAGISLTTKAGIFSFVWAVGNSKTQEIGFNQSKIHFGYISRF